MPALTADDCSRGSEDDLILHTEYKSVPLPTMTTNSACQLLLEKAQENVDLERTNWMTDASTSVTLTFADIQPMSRKVASAMTKRGMVKGDVVLYLTMDVTRIYTTILGVWRVGGVMYSSYPEDTAESHRTRIVQSKSKWVICDPPSVPEVRKAISGLPWSIEIITFGPVQDCTNIDELYDDDGEACPTQIIEAELDDPLLILCTSGTTGRSKGAVYTNRSLLAFFCGTVGVPYIPLPAFLLLRSTHVLGCLYPIRNILVGTWSVMMSHMTKLNIFKAVHDYEPILALGFPTYLQLLASPEAAEYNRESLMIILTGGMVVTQNFVDVMMTLPEVKFVMNGYGLTECGALATNVDLSGTDGYRLIPNVPESSVGRLYPNTSLKVLDLETGRLLGPNQKGELAVKSPIMCKGYWRQEEETKATFIDDGWMKTGDLGYYDENGFIFVLDRIKETFKYFNNHISPAEIEEVILRHPDVSECSCFGIKDPEGGDHIPRAVVTLRPQVEKAGQQVTAQQIKDFADSQLASYKKLRGGVFIVPELPKGKTGKVMRTEVASMSLTEE